MSIWSQVRVRILFVFDRYSHITLIKSVCNRFAIFLFISKLKDSVPSYVLMLTIFWSCHTWFYWFGNWWLCFLGRVPMPFIPYCYVSFQAFGLWTNGCKLVLMMITTKTVIDDFFLDLIKFWIWPWVRKFGPICLFELINLVTKHGWVTFLLSLYLESLARNNGII